MDETDPDVADDEASGGAIHVATEGESWLGPEAEGDLSPGSPSLENVAFVLLGMIVTLAVLAQFVI